MTGGRRCLPGPNSRLPGRQLRPLRRASGTPPPAGPRFRPVTLGTRGRGSPSPRTGKTCSVGGSQALAQRAAPGVARTPNPLSGFWQQLQRERARNRQNTTCPWSRGPGRRGPRGWQGPRGGVAAPPAGSPARRARLARADREGGARCSAGVRARAASLCPRAPGASTPGSPFEASVPRPPFVPRELGAAARDLAAPCGRRQRGNKGRPLYSGGARACGGRPRAPPGPRAPRPAPAQVPRPRAPSSPARPGPPRPAPRAAGPAPSAPPFAGSAPRRVAARTVGLAPSLAAAAAAAAAAPAWARRRAAGLQRGQSLDARRLGRPHAHSPCPVLRGAAGSAGRDCACPREASARAAPLWGRGWDRRGGRFLPNVEGVG
ncbi:cdc42 effector protein 3 isoform X1 [Vulpes lagopus]|uniref:cdc42 effector protein 3 isoform X1 n=1 Tax=Vulpes lagopus TaxID=494514 RepID=UPI001BC8F2A4|nr:cdc42 effector protein 3 isoform X1 [Vulpes lagopus]